MPDDFDSIDPAAAFADAIDDNSGLVTGPDGQSTSTPVVETPAATVPAATPAAPAPAGTPDSAPAPVPTWDGYDREEVDNALAIARGLRTPDGVRYIVGQGLSRLHPDIDTAQLQELVNTGRITPAQAQAVAEGQTPPAADDPLAGIGDDDVVTGAELRIAQEAAYQRALKDLGAQVQAQVKPIADTFQAQREATATAVVDSSLIELLSTDGTAATVDQSTAGLVLQHASKYLPDDDWNPSAIRNAIQRGHADAVAQVNAAHQALLAKQAYIAQTTPTSIGGSQSAGGEVPKVPESMDEARQMAQAMGFFN